MTIRGRIVISLVLCHLLIPWIESFAPIWSQRKPSTTHHRNQPTRRSVALWYAPAKHDSPPLTGVLLRISYDGARFTGWSAANDKNQTANDEALLTAPLPPRRGRRHREAPTKGFVRSVQRVLQSSLAKLYGNIDPALVVVEGCSRTDKGVHALSLAALIYALHPDHDYATRQAVVTGKRIPHPWNATDTAFLPIRQSLPDLAYALNRMLPWDVRVMAMAPMPTSDPVFHPTLSATAKTYRYRLSTGPIHDPTQWRRRWNASERPLDVTSMQAAAAVLVGCHDFGAFGGSPRGSDRRKHQRPDPTCTLVQVLVEETGAWQATMDVDIVFEGDRFLYKMVRFLVGALVAVGLGRMTPEDVRACLESGQRQSFECAPAHGLSLENVSYEGIQIDWVPITRC